MGGIGGGALGKLAGSLDFLNGFGALGGMNLDMSIAMTFVSSFHYFQSSIQCLAERLPMFIDILGFQGPTS